LPSGQAGALVGFGVGFLPGVLEAAAPVTTHVYEHTFASRSVASVRAAEAGVAFRVRAPSPLLRRIAELCGVADLLWTG
jgi:hypothetical protein